jgi:crotonobetainyl-CoA:carnitine CoA-transferase CaiB-like acyl-CoA transferase
VFLDLVREADAVVEAMRPGGLERRGVGFDQMREVNPAIVFVTLSGYGMTGPYRDLPSHGIAYDAWAGIIQPAVDGDGFTEIPPHTSVGINVGPVYGALAVLAGITQARATGTGLHLEVAQSDAAASMDWLRSETHRAYERPESEVTGNASDGFERRPPGTEGMQDGVRYQIYRSSDGHVLFMASEREFWSNFCDGIGRPELFERWPGAQYADHGRGNTELRRILTDIFATRTTAEWVLFGGEHNTALAPVNNAHTIADDPQFRDRLDWLPASALGADQLPNPIKPVNGTLATPRRAPDLGADTDDVLRSVLGWDDDRIAALRASGALGSSGGES